MLSIPAVAYNALQSPTPAPTHPPFDLASPGFNLALVFVLFPASPAPLVSELPSRCPQALGFWRFFGHTCPCTPSKTWH